MALGDAVFGDAAAAATLGRPRPLLVVATAPFGDDGGDLTGDLFLAFLTFGEPGSAPAAFLGGRPRPRFFGASAGGEFIF